MSSDWNTSVSSGTKSDNVASLMPFRETQTTDNTCVMTKIYTHMLLRTEQANNSNSQKKTEIKTKLDTCLTAQLPDGRRLSAAEMTCSTMH